MGQKSEAFPSEIAEQVKEFHLNLISFKKELQPILNNLYEIRDEASKDPIKSATLELTLLQAINSLFYMYLQTTGVEASKHSCGHELYRIQQYMYRLDAIKDKVLRPKVNKKAANAFVRNAMFDIDDKKNDKKEATSEPNVIEISDDDELEEKPTKRQKIN